MTRLTSFEDFLGEVGELLWLGCVATTPILILNMWFEQDRIINQLKKIQDSVDELKEEN